MGHYHKMNMINSLLISGSQNLYNKRKTIKERGPIALQHTRITNKSECKYLTLTILGTTIYGTGLKSKKLKIDWVEIVEDRTDTIKGFFSTTVLWDADFIIHTKDGEHINVRSTEEAFFKTIQKYL